MTRIKIKIDAFGSESKLKSSLNNRKAQKISFVKWRIFIFRWNQNENKTIPNKRPG